MEKYKITHIQLYDYAAKRQTSDDGDFVVDYSYSANLIINDSFVVQVSGNKDECVFDGITDPIDAFWNDKDNQERALNEVDHHELREALDATDFENNIGWLEDNAAEIMNPENATYRI